MNDAERRRSDPTVRRTVNGEAALRSAAAPSLMGFETQCRASDTWRGGDERVERALPLHPLSSVVYGQPIRRFETLRAASAICTAPERLEGTPRYLPILSERPKSAKIRGSLGYIWGIPVEGLL